MKRKHPTEKAAINGMVKTRNLLLKIKGVTKKPCKYILHDLVVKEWERLNKGAGAQ